MTPEEIARVRKACEQRFAGPRSWWTRLGSYLLEGSTTKKQLTIDEITQEGLEREFTFKDDENTAEREGQGAPTIASTTGEEPNAGPALAVAWRRWAARAVLAAWAGAIIAAFLVVLGWKMTALLALAALAIMAGVWALTEVATEEDA